MSAETTSEHRPSPKLLVAQALERGLGAQTLELPVMPSVASKVLGLTNDPNADLDDLSQLIHSDQSIASHVLRIANSASYSIGEPVVSLQQAVTRLGMNMLGEIAIAVSIQSDIFKAPGFEPAIRRLLRHALASAAYGREIARKRRRNVEGQFLCGLLHSVGKPIALQLIAQLSPDSVAPLNERDVDQVVDLFHLQISAIVIEQWRLPKQLQITTAFHHRYPEAPTFKDECAATYLSRTLASWSLEPGRFDATELARDPAFEFLNFYPDDVQDLLAKKNEVREIVAAMEL